MINEKGNISISTENIFPIRKKWWYSEKDIFVREIVSNSSDAISKLKKLQDIGEADPDISQNYQITVSISKDAGTIKVIDNGIGMTNEEVKKYINQIAFSGVKDFIEKYKDKTDEQQIIGHFGLGFYSAFMVATKVQIDTLSYKEGAQAVRWISSGDTEYEMTGSERDTVGTTVTIYVDDESKEYTEYYKMNEILRKYFSFLPYELYLVDEDEKKKESKEDKKEEIKPINNPNPLWKKSPKDCTDEEYKEFYRETFFDFQEPLFWIHLNMEYPFRMQGIIYFPKLSNEPEIMDGKIKLYYNQVFVADNIKEVIPEYLLMLKGMLDCPDLPLNVSRSYLQDEGYIKMISRHITKKMADKLNLLYKKELDNYTKYWSDINPFVKYGCMRESRFYERVKDIVIFKTINDEFITLNKYLEKNKENHENTVYYVNDMNQQSQYIKMFKENEMEALVLDTMIDNHFISFLESENKDIKFLRIDADLTSNLKDESEDDNQDQSKAIAEKIEKLFSETLNIKDLKLQVERLKTESTPALILLSEQSRRMQEMSKMYASIGAGMENMFPSEETLVINRNSKLVKALVDSIDDEGKKEERELIVKHIYDIALLNNKQMEPDELSAFVESRINLMEKLV